MKRALALVLMAGTAHADPLDTFGFGARATGMANATTAASSGAQAAHANPAAVVLASHPELVVGWSYARMGLAVDGSDANVLDVHGADIGVAIPVKVGPVETAFGMALYLPDQFVARVQLIPATEPHFLLLDNDVHRLVVEPMLAVRPVPWLAIGGGASMLVDAAGNGIRFDVGVNADMQVGESALDVSLPTRAAPVFGALVLPSKRLRLGATYRGKVDLGLQLDILANVDIGNITGDVLIAVRSSNYFTPQRVTAGAAYDVTDELTVTGELSWLDWSAFRGGAPDVRVLVDLSISPPLVEALFPPDGFHDTLVPRLGAEWRTHLGCWPVAFRGGYAYEPSPVPDQVGLTSFADNDRHILAAGFGTTYRVLQPILSQPITLDVGLQWHHLAARTTVKDQMLFPGSSFRSTGEILRAGTTLTVKF